MNGSFNRILRIDAAERSFDTLTVAEETYAEVLGGKGLATHLLLQHNPTGVDPLAPENHLILAAGPVAGTAIWGSCRHGLFTKSPQTGFYSESYSGGTVAECFAVSGYDAVMIHGASEDPIWIEISPETVRFHDATDLLGRETYDTEDRIKQWMKENRPQAKRKGVLVIGPAGENLVSFSVVENDYWRSAGRTGVGAVLGSKRIKGLAVWGDQKKEVADPNLVKRCAKELSTGARNDQGVLNYKNFGTPMLVDIMNTVGGFPTRYWKKGRADHADKINATALHERCDVTPHACRKCFIACGRLATVKEGRHEGPED